MLCSLFLFALTFDSIELQKWFTTCWKAEKLLQNQTDMNFCSRTIHFSTIQDQSDPLQLSSLHKSLTVLWTNEWFYSWSAHGITFRGASLLSKIGELLLQFHPVKNDRGDKECALHLLYYAMSKGFDILKGFDTIESWQKNVPIIWYLKNFE